MKLKWQGIKYDTRDHGKVEAEAATLAVPVRHDERGGAKLTLPVVRLPARSGRAVASVLFLAGGPGESGIEAGRGQLYGFFDALRETRNVILFDQRGTGASEPPLDYGSASRTLPVREPVRSSQVLAFVLERAMDCADRLREAGIDLDAYNTVESANDVAALCAALGKKPVHAVGHSYGSHLAMALIKKHPECLTSAVLAGPEGPDHTLKMPSAVQRQLQRIARATGERAFAGGVDAVLERLDMTPQDVKVAKLDGGAPEAMRIGRFDVEWIAAAGSADTRLLRVMPSWFARMSRGDYGTFADTPLVARYLRRRRLLRGRARTFTGRLGVGLVLCAPLCGTSGAGWAAAR